MSDKFLLAYEEALDARTSGSTDEELEALRSALSVAYDTLYPIGTINR